MLGRRDSQVVGATEGRVSKAGIREGCEDTSGMAGRGCVWEATGVLGIWCRVVKGALDVRGRFGVDLGRRCWVYLLLRLQSVCATSTSPRLNRRPFISAIAGRCSSNRFLSSNGLFGSSAHGPGEIETSLSCIFILRGFLGIFMALIETFHGKFFLIRVKKCV